MKYFLNYLLIIALMIIGTQLVDMSWLFALGVMKVIVWPLTFVYVVTLCKTKLYKN